MCRFRSQKSTRRSCPRKPRRSIASPRLIISKPRFFALFASIAFLSTVGSENGRIDSRPPRAPPYHSLGGFLSGFYREAIAAANVEKPLLTADQLDAYARDGYVVVSGLLDASELAGLVDAGEDLIDDSLEKGNLKTGNFQVHEFAPMHMDERFRDVAIRSELPTAAAELLGLDGRTQNLRVLRDVFLAKGAESTSSCGWHIDDQLFWPTSYKLPKSSSKEAMVDNSSLNAWIALDDMPHGGSMAVSPASHVNEFDWRHDALEALNFNDRFENGVSKDELVDLIKAGRVDSCGLEKIIPRVYDEIELSKREFDFKRGDVVFMNRWLFHRSTDLTERGMAALRAMEDGQSGRPALLKRYSLRYATGDSSLPGGFVTEMSVLASKDGSNLGRELDRVEGEWYPKVWPEVDADVEERLDDLVKNEVPIAKERLGAVMAEVMSLFRSR